MNHSLTIEINLFKKETNVLPILELAQEKGYLISIYVVEVNSIETLHSRLIRSENNQPLSHRN